MEQFRSKSIPQPWKKKLELRQTQRALGRAIIQDEGASISASLAKFGLDSRHSLRIDLFSILGKYLHAVSLDEYEFVALTNILVLLGYSEKDVEAVAKFLFGLQEKDNIYISQIIEKIIMCRILDSQQNDYQGFVRDCLPTKEKKLAVLRYIKGDKTKEIQWFVDDSTIEMIDAYIKDETIRARMIVLLEVETVV